MEQLALIRFQLLAMIFVMVGMLMTPLVFIALDYWAGIRKAKKRGDPIRSNKMQRTVEKISRYYNAILAMMVVDFIQISGFVFLYMFNGWDAYTFPVFTMMAVLFVAAIEIKSIYEPADVKEQRDLREVTALAKAIASHRDSPEEIAVEIAKYLSKNGTYGSAGGSGSAFKADSEA